MGFFGRVGVSIFIVICLQVLGVIPQGWFGKAFVIAILLGACWGFVGPRLATTGTGAGATGGAGKAAGSFFNWFFGILFFPFVLLGIILIINQATQGRTGQVFFYSGALFAVAIFCVLYVVTGRQRFGGFTFFAVSFLVGIMVWDSYHGTRLVEYHAETDSFGNLREWYTPYHWSAPLKPGQWVEVEVVGSAEIEINGQTTKVPAGGNSAWMLNGFPRGCVILTSSGTPFSNMIVRNASAEKAVVGGRVTQNGNLGFRVNSPILPSKAHYRFIIKTESAETAGAERAGGLLTKVMWMTSGRKVVIQPDGLSEVVDWRAFGQEISNKNFRIKVVPSTAEVWAIPDGGAPIRLGEGHAFGQPRKIQFQGDPGAKVVFFPK